MSANSRWVGPFERWWRWLPVVAWMALITYWSAQSELPIDRPSVDRLLRGQQHPLAHAAAFGILAMLVRWAVERTPGANLWAFLFASAFGAIDEWHQSFTPGRHPSIQDLIIDSMAAAVAVMVTDAVIQVRRAWRAGQWRPTSFLVPALALVVTLSIALSLLPDNLLPSRQTGRRVFNVVVGALPVQLEQPVRQVARTTIQVLRSARSEIRELARLAADSV
jgi:VanZ family protein